MMCVSIRLLWFRGLKGEETRGEGATHLSYCSETNQ